MKNEAAIALGRMGGAVRSEVKAAACRENGKRGGRPRVKPMTALEALRARQTEVVKAELERNRVENEKRMKAYG